MKTTIFYTVTFLAFLLGDYSMAVLTFILSVNCCSIAGVTNLYVSESYFMGTER